MAIHATPFTKNLLKALGGSGGVNPKTGLTEFQPNYGDFTYTSADGPTVQLGAYADALAEYDSFEYDDEGYLRRVGTDQYLDTTGFVDNNFDLSGTKDGGYASFFQTGYNPYDTGNDEKKNTLVSNTNYSQVEDGTNVDGGVVQGGELIKDGSTDGVGAVLLENGAIDNTAMMNQLEGATLSNNSDGLVSSPYGDFSYGDNNYQVGATSLNLVAQNPDEYSMDEAGNLVYTAANGQTYTLDATKLDDDFTGTNYIPDANNLKYFNSNNTVANSGDNSTGFTTGEDGLFYNNGELFTGMNNNNAYDNGVLKTSGTKWSYDPETGALMKDGELFTGMAPDKSMFENGVKVEGTGVTAVRDADGNIVGNMEGGVFTPVSSGSTGATDVFDDGGVKIGTMLDGVFTPIDTGGTGGTGGTGLTDTVVDGVLANTDPNDFAGQIAALKAEIKKLTSSAEEDLEVDGTNDFDGLIGKLEELFEKYMSSGYSPAALLNMFGFTDGDVSSDFNYMMPTYSGSDNVYTRKAVKDRDTGEMRYINVPIGDMAAGGGSFRENRRAGFGSMF
jgi:hypothetical protein